MRGGSEEGTPTYIAAVQSADRDVVHGGHFHVDTPKCNSGVCNDASLLRAGLEETRGVKGLAAACGRRCGPDSRFGFAGDNAHRFLELLERIVELIAREEHETGVQADHGVLFWCRRRRFLQKFIRR